MAAPNSPSGARVTVAPISRPVWRVNIRIKKSAIKLTTIGYTIDSDFPSSCVFVCDEKLTSRAVKSVTDPIRGRQTYAAAIKSSYTFDC